jgi:hypothetical protein
MERALLRSATPIAVLLLNLCSRVAWFSLQDDKVPNNRNHEKKLIKGTIIELRQNTKKRSEQHGQAGKNDIQFEQGGQQAQGRQVCRSFRNGTPGVNG